MHPDKLQITDIFVNETHVNFSCYKSHLFMSLPGTTLVLAILKDNDLVVANVGDSRGVLCDKNGRAIPLTQDHKPNYVSVFFFYLDLLQFTCFYN